MNLLLGARAPVPEVIVRREPFPPFTADTRYALADSLLGILPAIEELGAPEVLDAAKTLLALLRSPAPLDWRSVLPLMAELSERVAACFERGAREFSEIGRAHV